jgi:hypothetical protein
MATHIDIRFIDIVARAIRQTRHRVAGPPMRGNVTIGPLCLMIWFIDWRRRRNRFPTVYCLCYVPRLSFTRIHHSIVTAHDNLIRLSLTIRSRIWYTESYLP